VLGIRTGLIRLFLNFHRQFQNQNFSPGSDPDSIMINYTYLKKMVLFRKILLKTINFGQKCFMKMQYIYLGYSNVPKDDKTNDLVYCIRSDHQMLMQSILNVRIWIRSKKMDRIRQYC
jgi:hypothetical protein